MSVFHATGNNRGAETENPRKLFRTHLEISAAVKTEKTAISLQLDMKVNVY